MTVHEQSEFSLPGLIWNICLSLVPKCTQNGFEGVIQRSLHSAFENKVCLIATVRLAKPQFIKVRLVIFSSISHSSFSFIPRGLKMVVLFRTKLKSNCYIGIGISCQPLCAVPNCFSWLWRLLCLKILYTCVSFHHVISFIPPQLKNYC